MNTINFAQSIYANGLNKPNSYKYVYDVTGGYAAFTTLLRAISDIRKDAWEGVIMTGDGKYEFATQDTDWVVELITNTAQVSPGVIDVFYAGTNDFFLNKETTIDDKWVQGRIVSHAPGVVRLVSPDSTITLTAGTHYLIGGSVREFSDTYAFRASTGGESNWSIPTKDYDYVQTFRKTCFMAASDYQDTYIEFDGKSWGHAQVNRALQRLEIHKERQFLFGNRAVGQLHDGTNYLTGGLEWAIKNRGGLFVPIASAPSFATFNNILYQHQLKKVKTKGMMNDIILAGAGWINYMQQNYTQDFVKYSGRNNTFGGEIAGLNVDTWGIGMRTYDIVELPVMNDPNWYNVPSTIPGFNGASQLSMSFFIIDPNTIPGLGNGLNRAPIQTIWWGNKGISAGVIKGMIDANGNAIGGSMSNFNNISSSVDGMQVEIIEKTGLHTPSTKGFTYAKVVA